MVNSRSLLDLDPAARNVCNAHLSLCHDAGIELIITSTWRDFEAQDALWAIGRTVQKTKPKVTNAKAGSSWHNYRVAWDVVPVVHGKAVWNSPFWKDVIKFGKQAGAQAGAEWTTFPDKPHFQVTPLQAGKSITLKTAMELWNKNGTIFV